MLEFQGYLQACIFILASGQLFSSHKLLLSPYHFILTLTFNITFFLLSSKAFFIPTITSVMNMDSLVDTYLLFHFLFDHALRHFTLTQFCALQAALVNLSFIYHFTLTQCCATMAVLIKHA